jgi:hypothetical protein
MGTSLCGFQYSRVKVKQKVKRQFVKKTGFSEYSEKPVFHKFGTSLFYIRFEIRGS